MNNYAPVLTLFFLVLPACTQEKPQDVTTAGPPDSSTSGSTPDIDADGDGLHASFESTIGTSDNQPDTDADGCSDTVEVLGYFDPLVATDRPYTEGYPRGPRPDDAMLDEIIQASGETFEEGSFNPNWTLTDQHGEEIELRDFFGQVAVIDIVAEWCEPCQEATPRWEEFYQAHKEEGVVVIQILVEGVQNNSEPDAARWADHLGVTFPVVTDYSPGDYTVTKVAQYYLDVVGPVYDLPNASILDRQQIIADLYHVNLESYDSSLETLLAEKVPTVHARLPDNADELRTQLGLTPGSWITPASLCTTGGGS